ncbi:hypothetical protein ACFSCV_07530 [Methylopila henanensis]|uniref:Uncharacterized protein n=1 Tax=Methylopila henanensis TaxID=873516 RepID=A0ABW4K8G7_9HYPH
MSTASQDLAGFRATLVEQRVRHVRRCAKAGRSGATASNAERLTQIQNAIEAIDRALADDQAHGELGTINANDD